MASATASLRMRFLPADTESKVSRATLNRLVLHLGCKSESDAVHYAVRKLADEMLPNYEPDDGPLTAEQLAAIRKVAGPKSCSSVLSSLF